jgi:hypothetical protein
MISCSGSSPCRGNFRLSILALWSPLVSFEYGLAIGSFTSETYIKIMDWQFLPNYTVQK